MNTSIIANIVAKINEILAIPALILFLSVGVIITFKLRFLQFRGLPRAFHMLFYGGQAKIDSEVNTLSPIKALFSAMAATVGMGNIVGPPMAIALGGPGALFWMLVYIIFGTATKCVEVAFAVYARSIDKEGDIIGGPSQYLKLISPVLGKWYAILTVILFTAWSSIQVNTLSSIWLQEGVPSWISGLIAVSILLAVVLGGVQRIGNFAGNLVPLKFMLYVTFALIILVYNHAFILSSIKSIFTCAFSFRATCAGISGAGLMVALREGIYKSIFITESGLGTASISHSLTSAKKPMDQGILAIFSGVADFMLCALSGLLTLVTSVWLSGKLSNTLIYEVFKHHSPLAYSEYFFLAVVLLFVLTALVGNTYNGSQSFVSLVGYKYANLYFIGAALISYFGAFVDVPLIWSMLDVLLVIVAIPNLIGIVILAFKYSNVLKS